MPEQLHESVAVRMIPVVVPLPVGVPLKTPVLVLSVMPVGGAVPVLE